jgi:hypothetical protein
MKNLLQKFFLLSIVVLATASGQGQSSNADYTKGSINVNLPKTPESQSFEKYGNIPVDEYSGVPNISIPLYSLKSKFLELPLMLSYHASGIKVSQEATWVGLGFDLMAGGRITVETRGNVDKAFYSGDYRAGVSRLFNKWSKPYGPYQNMSNNAIKVGYAFLDYGEIYGSNDPIYHRGDTLWDDYSVVSGSAWEGDGQPDIYHASFLGNSVSFFFDLETGDIRQIGERSLFSINATRDANYLITGFIITDNSGVQYHFEQNETTYFTIPFGGTVNFSANATSAWLLTKIKHPDDEIILTYSNYGTVKPAVNWSQSITGHMPNPVNDPGDTRQNTNIITSKYLTRVESGNTQIDFTLSTRIDLEGDGARKLDKISVTAKETNAVVKEFLFEYDYFTATAQAGDNNLPPHKAKRLKLLSVKENNAASAPWKFYYNSLAGPNKYSFSQDHWGYYNASWNTTLVPNWNAFVNPYLGLHYEPSSSCNTSFPNQCFSQLIGYSIPNSFQGTANRVCNPNSILVYSLDSIVYPTGGSTKFIFEPHVSNFAAKQVSNFIGGGIRVTEVKHYAATGNPESIVTYDYQNSGIYLGGIEYLKVSTKWPQGNSFTLSAWGVQNNDAQTVGYGVVKKAIKNYLKQANNGYEIKYFKANTPLNPENVHAPQPYCYYYNTATCYSTSPNSYFYYLDRSGNGPMPKRDLDGKLYRHEVYSNSNTLVKSTDYYYRQAEVNNRFFSIKAEDNYLGYQYSLAFQQAGYASADLGQGASFTPMTWRRWLVSLEPATSYFTLLDSVVENTLTQSGNYVKSKKAFTYNSYYQQEYTVAYNSDGSQSISYLRTPLSFIRPQIPSLGDGESYEIEQLRTGHFYDFPIEQISIERTPAGDSLVTGAVYNAYESARLKNVYLLEANTPLSFRTQFVPTYYTHNYPTLPSFYLTKDTRYKLQETAVYSGTGLVKGIVSLKGNKAFVWDDSNNTLLAACENAGSGDIAFSSFETNAKGNWDYSGTTVTDANVPTGTKSYDLGSGQVSKTSLSAGAAYIVSYWSSSGPKYVNGSSATSGRSFNGYTYYEHKVSNPAGGVITVSGSGNIDELRLYPENALMTSYTYKPLIGISSQCDANNRISYYTYDPLLRLELIIDQDKNILKKICYNYAGQPENCQTCLSQNPDWQNTMTPPVCQQGSCGNTGYQLQEQRDMNPCSPTYDSLRTIEIYNPAGCAIGSGINITYNNLLNTVGFTATYTNSSTGQVYSFSIPSSGSGVLGCIPAGTYSLSIAKTGFLIPALFGTGCYSLSGTSAYFNKVIVGPPSNCNIIALENDY